MGLEFCGTSLFKRFENFRLNLLSWKCVHIFCIRTICLFLTCTGLDFKFLLKLGTIFVISCIKQIKRQTYKNKGLKKIKKNVKYIHYLKVNHSKNQEATHRLKNMLFKEYVILDKYRTKECYLNMDHEGNWDWSWNWCVVLTLMT